MCTCTCMVCVCVCVRVFCGLSKCVSVRRLPHNGGLTGLGRTTVITSTLSHKQMAKQMILAHLTHDHPYLFHGCWPTDSPCLSLLHECLGRERAADAHKCLENKTGMKKEASEKENKRGRAQEKKL